MSAYAKKIVISGALLTVAFSCLGCSSRKQNTSDREQTPSLNSSKYFTDSTPMTDGSAYVVSDKGMWYLRGNQAARVRFSPPPKRSHDDLYIEVIPLADGSAYAVEALEATIWHLNGTSATVVKEVQNLTSPEAPVDSHYFSQYANERRKRINAEIDALPDPSEED